MIQLSRYIMLRKPKPTTPNAQYTSGHRRYTLDEYTFSMYRQRKKVSPYRRFRRAILLIYGNCLTV